jgi:hypothetical protein
MMQAASRVAPSSNRQPAEAWTELVMSVTLTAAMGRFAPRTSRRRLLGLDADRLTGQSFWSG